MNRNTQNRPEHTRLRSWLAAERDASDPSSHHRMTAEERLSELLSALPALCPSSAFVDRVLDCTVRAQEAPTRWFTRWWLIAAVVICAIQPALIAGGGAAILGRYVAAFGWLGLANGTARVLTRALEWTLEAARVGFDLTRAGELLLRAAASPAGLSVLALCLLSSAAGLFILSNVVPSRRVARHVA